MMGMGLSISMQNQRGGGTPPWVLPRSSVDLLFSQSVYYGGNLSDLVSVSRTQTTLSYAATSLGSLVSFLANTPRITDLGLLKEGSSTNLILQSQTLATSPWVANASGSGVIPTATNNFAVAPDGTSTATRIQLSLGGGTTTGDISFWRQPLTLSTSTIYTYSLYMKSNTASSYILQFQPPDTTGNHAVTVTPTWQRFIITGSNTITNTLPGVRLRGGVSPTNSNTADILVWGSQVEQQSVVSSYIPTTTVSSTRGADNIIATGALATALSLSTGSLGVATTNSLAATAGTLIDSNGNILLGKTASDTLTDNLVAGLTTANTAVWTGSTKSFISWSGSGRSLALNNGTPATDANAMTPSVSFHIGSTSGSSAFDNAYTSRITVWGSVVPQSFFNVAIVPGDFYAWGDSLTEGNEDGSGVTYPNALASLYSPTRNVVNKGVGGNTSSQILTRFQALPSSWNYPTAIWSGRNNYTNPNQVKADIATMVADLTTKEYIIISNINGDAPSEWAGQANYNTIVALNADLASTYGNNYLDIRSVLVASYNPLIGPDVVDYSHDVPPFSLRAIDLSGMFSGNVGASDTSFVLTPTGGAVYAGVIMTVASEYIYVSAVSGNTVTACIRGFGNSVPASYAGGQAYVGTDSTHLNAAGYTIVANMVYAKIQQLGGW